MHIISRYLNSQPARSAGLPGPFSLNSRQLTLVVPLFLDGYDMMEYWGEGGGSAVKGSQDFALNISTLDQNGTERAVPVSVMRGLRPRGKGWVLRGQKLVA